MARHARLLALATSVALIASGATVTAAGGPRPMAPTNAKTLKKGVPFTFKVRSTESGSVFLKVSKSKRKNSKGTLRTDVYFRKMGKRKGTTIYTKKTERYAALSSYFLNKPGRYYWQAYRIDCAAQADCEVEGAIRSFRIR